MRPITTGLVPLSRLRVDPAFARSLPPPPNLDGMREDIRRRGVLVPLIATRDGLVLDGHTRLGIARDLGLEDVPVVALEVGAARTWARTVALALNLHRRHLTLPQRVQIGTSLERVERKRARERRADAARRGGLVRQAVAHGAPLADRDSLPRDRATDRVATAIGVSRNTYERAKRVLDRAPAEVRRRMLSGDLSIAGAARKLRAHEVAKRARAEPRARGPGLWRELNDAPSGRWRCLYVDPPWEYRDGSCEGAAEHHYATMPLEELAALDVARLTHPDGAHLWLWATWPKIREGAPARLLAAWGFRWVGEVVWAKPSPSVGRWLRSQSEVLILGVRGKVPLLVDDAAGLISAPRRRHSEKPPEARALVERCSPGPRIELFARAVPEGWDAVGREARRV